MFVETLREDMRLRLKCCGRSRVEWRGESPAIEDGTWPEDKRCKEYRLR